MVAKWNFETDISLILSEPPPKPMAFAHLQLSMLNMNLPLSLVPCSTCPIYIYSKKHGELWVPGGYVISAHGGGGGEGYDTSILKYKNWARSKNSFPTLLIVCTSNHFQRHRDRLFEMLETAPKPISLSLENTLELETWLLLSVLYSCRVCV